MIFSPNRLKEADMSSYFSQNLIYVVETAGPGQSNFVSQLVWQAGGMLASLKVFLLALVLAILALPKSYGDSAASLLWLTSMTRSTSMRRRH